MKCMCVDKSQLSVESLPQQQLGQSGEATCFQGSRTLKETQRPGGERK